MNIIISNTSDTPIYLQIARCIQNDIVNGTLSGGDALPSIRALAKELSVSVITTKKSYEILESQGYIQTQPGKGSVVSLKSSSLAREHKMSSMEQSLLDAIDVSKELGMEYSELAGMLELLYKEENK